MCKCTPEERTPYCGRRGCEWPSYSADTSKNGGDHSEQPRDKVADDHIPDATKMVPDDRCRAEFEREFQRHDMRRDEGGEQYAWVNVRCLWEGWQAAWNARSCARDQDTVSQFCGEAVALRGEMDTLIAERARLRTALAQIADKDTYGVNGRGAFAQIANDALEGI